MGISALKQGGAFLIRFKKNKDDDLSSYPKETNVYLIQNRTAIIERNIILVLVVFLILLVAYICFDKTVNTNKNVLGIKETDMNSKYLDKNKVDADKSGNNGDESNDELAFDYSKSIICWGDSFSDNSSNSTNFYTYYLTEQLMEIETDINGVFSSGVDGDNMEAIAAKQGGIPMFVQPCSIPADDKSVPITLKNSLGSTIILQDKLNSGLNPCTISGIEGEVYYVNGKPSFIRSKNGNAYDVKTPTTLVTNAMSNIKGYTGIYFFGADYGKYTPEQVVDIYKSMIKFQGNQNYIVIGSVIGTKTKLEPYEHALEDAFGNNYINLRAYLTEDVFNDYEIKINSKDAKALSDGSVPPCFILNGKRLSDSGSKILADLVYNKLAYLDLS